MTALAHMQPRDVATATRLVSTLTAVGAGITVLFAVLTPGTAGLPTTVVTIAISVGLAIGALFLRRATGEHRLAWSVFPFLAVIAITLLDVLTRDASAGSQVFFFFPALYAASQLRRHGAAALCLAAVAGDLIVVFTLLPPRTAVVQGSYLTGAVVTTVALLVLAGERQEQLISQLQRQAAIDPLTGLVTRRVLDSAAHSALNGAASGSGTALILLDVDNFKQINDQHGHPAGDEVLIRLAALLMTSTRPTDTISRMGGDEIAVLMAGCSEAGAARRAEQILWDVRAHTFAVADGVDITVSVSIGLAHVPTHALDLRSLYAAADAALYVAKRNGRDQIGTCPAELKSHPAMEQR
ncbi:MAG: GGDEF domain-containing protein [Actinobacteria bacterium]|nr:GGDEF domain-containing protein [Actinomycetota bacterium]